MSSICKCPICDDGDLIEKDKLFECSNSKSEKDDQGKWVNSGTCTYKIFKSSLTKLGHPEVTADEVYSMITNGEHEFSLRSQKTGKDYTAKGVPDERFGIKINFDFKN